MGQVTKCNQKPGTSWLLSAKGEDLDSPVWLWYHPPLTSCSALLTEETRNQRHTFTARGKGISVALACVYTPTALLHFIQQEDRISLPPATQ